MSVMTIQEFCNRHGACQEGREWELANCETMADVWATAKPDWLVWVATRPGVLTDRELRVFAVWSAMQVGDLLADPRSLAALDVAERYTHGEATVEELAAARSAAREAARSAAVAAARAAGAAARSAARLAAEAEAWSAAWEAAWEAARSAQCSWLRENTTPRFDAKEEGR